MDGMEMDGTWRRGFVYTPPTAARKLEAAVAEY